jgi:integrase
MKSGEHALSIDEVRRLLSGITVFRDEILIRLAIETAMRREDIVAIELCNVTINNDNTVKIKFWENKKKRYWTVYVGGETARRLIQYINLIKTETKQERWIFPSSQKGKHITGRTAYNIFQYWLRVTGVRKENTPFHALRATAIKLMKARGYTIEEVMRVTGDTQRVIAEHYAYPSDAELKDIATKKPVLDT